MIERDGLEPLFIRCSCGFSEHMLILNDLSDLGEDFKELSLEVHLRPRPFFKRIWIAIRYVFGYRSRYGEFDEVLIDRYMANEIMMYLAEFLEIALVSEEDLEEIFGDDEEEEDTRDIRFAAA